MILGESPNEPANELEAGLIESVVGWELSECGDTVGVGGEVRLSMRRPEHW